MNGMTFDGYMNVLGTLMNAENGDAVLGTLPETTQQQFLQAAIKEDIGVYCLWKVPQTCHKYPEVEKDLQIQDYKCQIRNTLRKQTLMKLFAGLEERHIFFVPLKGVDLAYRVYPSCQLRPFTDFDILFKREDWNKVEEFFSSEGWEGGSWKINENMHHIAPIVKGGMMLEPHWTLPCFDGVSPAEIWKHCRPVEPDGYRCLLSPEVYIMMLVRHLRERDYIKCHVSRFLLDVHFMLKHDTVDWKALRELAQQWHFVYPGDMLGTFPKAFSESLLEAVGPDMKRAQLFREIFIRREAFFDLSMHDLQVHEMMAGQSERVNHWLNHLKPEIIRRKYKLPADASYAKVLRCTIKDIYVKLCAMMMGIVNPHHELKDFLELVEKVDK